MAIASPLFFLKNAEEYENEHAAAARHRRISFGKHKGKQLGTLPNAYLRWMVSSLGKGLWGMLAKEVLLEKQQDDWKASAHQKPPSKQSLGYVDQKQEYATILRRCSRTKALGAGKQVHARIVASGHERDTFLGNLLVQMYGKCGNMEHARAVFDGIPLKNVFSWAIMIAAYVESQNEKQAIELYRKMESNPSGVQPDMFIFSSVLAACAKLGCLEEGKTIHARIVARKMHPDVTVQNSLVSMYAKCGCFDHAKAVFESMQQRDVVSWNAMVAAYAQAGHPADCLELYREMDSLGVQPNVFTFASIVDACSRLDLITEGGKVHARIVACGFESDVVVGTALVNMLVALGNLGNARAAFDKIRQKDALSWNTMIAAYAQHEHCKEVLELYRRMRSEHVEPNEVTFACVLGACSSLGALADGKVVHAQVIDCDLESSVIAGTAIVNMYAKCGSLDEAWKIFSKIRAKDAISWTTMVAAYARHGHGDEAMRLFHEVSLQGVGLDEIAFTNILGACSHAGLLEESWRCFISMRADHGITPVVEHFRCMITLLARAGRLSDAEDLINNMPFEADAVAWMTLLGACKMHKDVERGARAADAIVQMQPADATPYVLLSNLLRKEGAE